MNTQIYTSSQPFHFESGQVLSSVQIGYHTYGKLNPAKDNVIWVCHALTANSDVMDWWKGLFGEQDYFNPQDHFIVCANILGSPYGSSNPLHINPATKSIFGLNFPQITIRDMVAAHRLVAEYLGIDQIKVLIGGSLGGQQAVEWSIMANTQIENLILIATNANHSPWGIAFNESQRLALQADATFGTNLPEGGKAGLKAARSIALLSYRNYETYTSTQQEESNEHTNGYKAASYQNYQGEKLVNRFNAYSYWYLSKAMDSHHVGRNRCGPVQALGTVTAKTLVIGIDSDLLFPVAEQQYLARYISGASYAEFNSFYGHDGFLIETGKLTRVIASFLAS